MAEKGSIQQVMLKDSSGQWIGPIPIGVLTKYIIHNGYYLSDIIGTYDVSATGSIADQLDSIRNKLGLPLPGEEPDTDDKKLKVVISKAQPAKGPAIWIERTN